MMSYSERNMHRRSIVFALCGLFFACLSAGLIVTTFRPVLLRTVVVVVEETQPTTTSRDDNNTPPIAMVVEETRWVRGGHGGNRRQLSQKSNEMDPTMRTMSTMFASSSSTSSTVAPSNPTPSPIVQPTVTLTRQLEDNDNNNNTTTTVHSSTGSASKIATESIAAAMVGVASSIIICALGLYCSDLRQRRRHEKWTLPDGRHRHSGHHHTDDQDALEDDNSSQKSAFRSRTAVGGSESMTSAGSTHEATSTSGNFVVHDAAATGATPVEPSTSQELVEYRGQTAVVNHQSMLLPPMIADDVAVEEEGPCNNALALTLIPNDDASISRVSTLTMSLKEGGYSYGGSIEEKLSRYAIQSSSDVTELDDAHRVSDDTQLTSLVKQGMANEEASVCSSLTNGSQNSGRLLGEECLDAKFQHTPDTTPFASLEVSPDTPLVEEDDIEPGPESEEDDDDFTIDSHELEKKNELVQLEQLLAGIPNDEMSHGAPASADDAPSGARSGEPSHQARVRDVCFLPITTDGKMYLGLELTDASSDESFPTVYNVAPNSPLVGLLIVGDAIVAINEMDTRGLSSVKALEVIDNVGLSPNDHSESGHVPPKMFKLTVMGSKPNDGDDNDDGDDDDDTSGGQLSIDLASATEV